MHKVKIGIPFNENYAPNAGGGFSYTTQLLKAIDDYQFNDEIEIVFLDFTGKTKLTFNQSLLSFHPFKNAGFSDFIRKTILLVLRKLGFRPFKHLINRIEHLHAGARDQYIVKNLRSNNIALLFYANPDGNTFNYPFITTHWDIGHESTYMFPEFAESLKSRQNYYNHVIVKALAILTETETGKKELIRYTNLNKDRISVMPMFPGNIINQHVEQSEQHLILQQYGLNKNEFFIYPAQFWAHKNHITLIDAFKLLLSKRPNLKLVLTGSDKGNLEYIKFYLNNNNLKGDVKMLGFVSNAELYTFYKNAIALTMPTFLGPSNMPPLEAANLGCPVLLSDLEGHRELMGDYPTYFDPLNAEDLAEKMWLQVNAISEQKPFPHQTKFSTASAMEALEKTFLKVLKIRKNWA
ncbi:hypothetical protein DHW03_16635 [Pedobacter yonginense]|uniref:Glycosyl transferase family 1 domain-containing protein n=1 Tax=Pedobacter yonginense TaxID=651869 RepID=A0A317EJV7_9SPHI|nr:glycosyltransferase family 1 protein [Pedobacter yonginense]PWS26407.1 hypothetical protein DHW03_16635 [Pedobacter yonginense]